MLETLPATSLAIKDDTTLEIETPTKVGNNSSKASTSVVSNGINQKLKMPIDNALKIRLKHKIQLLQSRCWSLEKASNSSTVRNNSSKAFNSVTVGNMDKSQKLNRPINNI